MVALVAAVILVSAGVTGMVRAAGPDVAVTPSPSPSLTPSAPPTATPSGVTAQMAALAAGLPPGSVSVAARNLTTGATLRFGSAGHQTAASIVKVDILQTLLLQHQKSGTGLTDDQDDEATSMIEDSDDDAAADLWDDIGGGPGMAAANRRLGLRCTVPGPGPEWGLTTTCARDQVRLLFQLESNSSPLDEPSRAYILNLMENVSPSQAWGIPVVADSDTDFAVKNGWLNLDGETDWAVNSDGIVAYQGQTLLIAVLTQNNDTVYSGVALVQQLAQLAAQSVAS